MGTRSTWLASAAVLAALASGPLAARAADAAHPTVVELFQSQGCSSCPPANAAVMALTAHRPDLLMLSWQVTYWDGLGWKDSFGDPAFTARQRDYAQRWGRGDVFTPEVVVNGRSDLVGSDRDELARAVAAGDRGDGGPVVAVTPGEVSVSGGGTARGSSPAAATVVLVRYDPRLLQVPIGRGENGGRTLPHRDVVREVRVLGEWSAGETRRFAVPAPTRPGLDEVVLVQAGSGGPILAATQSPK